MTELEQRSPFPLPPAGGAAAQRRGGNTARPTERARQLRNTATLSEKRLWLALKSRKVAGAKFSRQIPIGPYFADFVCRDLRLIVEIDGPSHDLTWQKDEVRTAYLNAQGYRVIRFSNEVVRTNLDGVVAAIADALNPTPLASQAAPPTGGRGK